MSTDNNYENMQTVFWTEYLRILKGLKEPVDKERWHMAPYETNAYYSITDNEIVFLAGLLQSPLYSKTFPDSYNYGALGSMVGHEITHGFDEEGRLFDQDGAFRDWWDKEDMKKFKAHSECFVEQYSNFRDTRVNKNVSGINTLDENIADNGGLEASYYAYKKLTREKGAGPKLPGLGFTHDQLFFLGFAQVHCEKSTKQSLLIDILFDEHSPDRFRAAPLMPQQTSTLEACSWVPILQAGGLGKVRVNCFPKAIATWHGRESNPRLPDLESDALTAPPRCPLYV
ncbi:endothelin-converting enzyme 1 [Elysia marginata]|uniref:Endothelin-converting enzyme 1 n=1 Tax=Elysia marginata TaxID=1093978 RepID=A0AAV4EXC5_9GAST|nr:endothelin-converting enzyme 1 [Elysia marginata]